MAVFDALFCFERVLFMDGYKTIREMAEKWNLTPRMVQKWCAEGKIPGASRFGRVWAIPEDAERPVDGRVTTGEYKNWRKKVGRQPTSDE